MPKYIMPEKETVSIKPVYRLIKNNETLDLFKFTDIDEFTQGYIEALFFTENSYLNAEEFEELQKAEKEIPEGSIPNDVSWLDFDQDTMETIIIECKAFQEQNYKEIENLYSNNLEQAGHDFWLSRNGHGAGFWDRYLDYKENRDWYKEIGDALHAKCGWRTDFPEVNVYFQDGKIYI